mmetsp:Transcript_21615/g.74235  ORF Transcript_21615/g.74235 Transcript_21615/m.74235 type:complete len:237 (-) Transcript_21615:240-950(-)
MQRQRTRATSRVVPLGAPTKQPATTTATDPKPGRPRTLGPPATDRSTAAPLLAAHGLPHPRPRRRHPPTDVSPTSRPCGPPPTAAPASPAPLAASTRPVRLRDLCAAAGVPKHCRRLSGPAGARPLPSGACSTKMKLQRRQPAPSLCLSGPSCRRRRRTPPPRSRRRRSSARRMQRQRTRATTRVAPLGAPTKQPATTTATDPKPGRPPIAPGRPQMRQRWRPQPQWRPCGLWCCR